MTIKRIIDILMTALLLLSMAYHITEAELHEYAGVLLIVLFAVHNYLNRHWYGALLRGRYAAPRLLITFVNLSLLICVIAVAWSGAVMSEYVFPALNSERQMEAARLTHLASSYWLLALIGIHVGLHVRFKNLQMKTAAFLVAALGAYFFFNSEMFSYMTLQTQFVYFDYDESAAAALAKSFAVMMFWGAVGSAAMFVSRGPWRRVKADV